MTTITVMHARQFAVRVSKPATAWLPNDQLAEEMMSVHQPLKRCVIVDDTRASRELVSRWLGACRFECELADNGLQALELVTQRPPDLLVTDLEMPTLCGSELLECVRHADDPALRRVPVLVMTSLRDGQTLQLVTRLGGNGLLHKPLDKHETLSAILNLIANRDMLDQWKTSELRTEALGKDAISPTLRRLLQTVATK